MRSSSSSSDLNGTRYREQQGSPYKGALGGPKGGSASYGNLLPLFTSTLSPKTPQPVLGASSSGLGGSNQQLMSMIPAYLATQYETEVTSLFEKNTPDQMKSIEYSKRAEIEDMKNQLKNLIGNKYRDLVEGSDAIVKMEKSTELINEKVVRMQNELKSFSDKRNSRKIVSPQFSQRNKKKEVQNRIVTFSKYTKQLVDLPETIWRSLDSNEYFEVSVEYLRSELLYNRVINEDNIAEVKSLLLKLPVIQRQWEILKEFPSKSIYYSFDYLRISNNISLEKYIGSLSVFILFEKKSVKEVFQQFLQSRRSLLFSMISKLPSSSSTARHIIHKLIEFIKLTVYLILLIFYPTRDHSQQLDDDEEEEEEEDSLLDDLEIPDLKFTSSKLESQFTWKSPYLKDCLKVYFETVNQSDNSLLEPGVPGLMLNSNESYQYLEERILEFENLNPKYFIGKSSEWIDQVLDEFKSNSNLYLSSIGTAKELSNLKTEVFKEILQFSSPIDSSTLHALPLIKEKVLVELNSTTGDLDSPSTTPSLPSSSGGDPITWNTLFSIVCASDRDGQSYFYDVFDDIFLLKAERIIETSFSKISLENIINDSHLSSPAKPDISFTDYLWTYHDDPIQSIKNKASGITPTSQWFISKMNQQYSDCISDFIYLFVNSNNESFYDSFERNKIGGTSPSLLNKYNKGTRRSGLSAASPSLKRFSNQQSSLKERHQLKENELREYMKKSFNKSFIDFSSSNQTKIDNLLLRKDINQILYISKISKIVFNHILNNHEMYFTNLQSNTGNTSSVFNSPIASTSTATNSSNEILNSLKQQFYYGSIIWVQEIVQDSSKRLKEKLLIDSIHFNDSESIISHWEKLKIEIDTESGKSESEIYIPYQPSPYIIEFLLSISIELSKVSFHLLDKNLSKYLVELISNSCYQILDQLFNQQSAKDQRESQQEKSQTDVNNTSAIKFCKESYLQLLIDFKFISIILFGKKIQSTIFEIKDKAFKNAVQHYQSVNVQQNETKPPVHHSFTETISLIQSRIEPIDLMFYENQITKFLENAYTKSSSLFGNFTQIHKSIFKSTLSPISSTADKKPTDSINSLPIIKSKITFQLLPIDSSSQSTQSSTSNSPTLTSQDFQSRGLKQFGSSISTPTSPPTITNTASTQSSVSLLSTPINATPILSSTNLSFMSKRISEVFSSSNKK